MGRSGVITFKGNPMTLLGDDLAVGAPAPAFSLIYADNGLQELTLDDLKGKPSIISVVPSLDTPTCAIQTKRFNQDLGALGDKINAVTVSRDLAVRTGEILWRRRCVDADRQRLPDARLRYRLRTDHRRTKIAHTCGGDSGCRRKRGLYKEVVAEVTEEPDYDAAMAALRMLL